METGSIDWDELRAAAQEELLRREAQEELERREDLARRARESLAEFFRQAVAAGAVAGIKRLEWGPHLDFYCLSLQLHLESWLVANGMGTPEMVERQREAWERTGATWEDGKPEPWLRYVLAGNQIDNLPPTTLKSTISCVISNAWIWLWAPSFSFIAASGVEANVDRDSQSTRDLVRSSWYRDTFSIAWDTVDSEIPIEVRKDSTAIRLWETTAGGKRDSRTINSGWIGAHGDCVAGETLVATEIGDVPICELVAMNPMPQVWSFNHSSGLPELASVLAWRRIDNRSTVDVCVSSDRVLRCTGDHRIYTDSGYIAAKDCVGRRVSIMQRSKQAWQRATARTMPQVFAGDTDLRDVFQDVHAELGGVPQEEAQKRVQVRPVLLDGMSAHEPRWSSSDDDMPGVRLGVQTARHQEGQTASILLHGMRGSESGSPLPGSTLRDVWNHDARHLHTDAVLLEKMQGQGALGCDDGCEKLELQRAQQTLLRRPLAGDSTCDQGARRQRVRCVPELAGTEGIACSPHRRGSWEQHATESHHAVSSMPHCVPSIGYETVLSATPSPARVGGEANSVYDIQVARNHNFFASGVLVHNCMFIDDPDDPDKVFNEADRLKPQNRFTRAMENRTNDDNKSIRRVLQQATHIEDFTAYLLSLSRWSPANPKGWHYNCLPAEYGHGPDDAPTETPYGQRDWRTQKGETLSARLSPGVLADHKLKRPEYEALYNQNRKRRIGGIFHPRYARFFIWEHQVGQWLRPRPDVCVSREESPPVVIKPGQLRDLTLSIDAANSLDPNPGAKVSAVGLTVNACRGEERLVLDDATRVLGVHGTYKAIYQLAARWALDRILVEEKALGAGVLAELMLAIRRGWYIDPETDERVELLGPGGGRLRCVVEPYKPGKEDKVQRAHGMLPSWQQRLWLLHDGADWLYPKVDESRKTLDEGWIGEVCSFPGSRRTDRVDSESQFAARYRQAEDPREKWRAMSRLSVVRR